MFTDPSNILLSEFFQDNRCGRVYLRPGGYLVFMYDAENEYEKCFQDKQTAENCAEDFVCKSMNP